MATRTFYPINTPLINYFFYQAPLSQDGANVPVSGGFLFFLNPDDHNEFLPTFSDISDPENPVVNENPLELSLAGSCPLFYLEDRPYDIVLTGPDGDLQNPIDTIHNYWPSQVEDEEVAGFNTNILVNGQFTFPLLFWELSDAPGTIGITNQSTSVAWAWKFLQDNPTTTLNNVTFVSISNDDTIPGTPLRELQLISNSPSVGEQTKDLFQVFGPVNFLSGQQVTFSALLKNNLGSTAQVNVFIEQNFGSGGSEAVFTYFPTITFDTTRTTYSGTITIPSIAGMTVADGSYIAIHIQGQLGQVCNWAITNVKLEQGEVSDPVYQSQPFSDEVAGILGECTQIEPPLGLFDNFAPEVYANGAIQAIPRTGEIIIYPTHVDGGIPPYLYPIGGAALPVNGYTNTIPNLRLYNKIGQTFGGAGFLAVSSTDNQVDFTSGVGGRPDGTFTAGTTGFTMNQIVRGLDLGVNCAITSANTVQVTWLGTVVPVQTAPPTVPIATGLPGTNPAWSVPNNLIGNWFITSNTNPNAVPIKITLDHDGTSPPAQATITFQSNNPADYKLNGTRAYTPAGGLIDMTYNFLEFATVDHNTRGIYYNGPGTTFLTSVISFSFNGQSYIPFNLTCFNSSQIPLTSADTISTIMQKFVARVANPYRYRMAVTGVPPASSYFIVASPDPGDEYGGYYIVDGVGTEPVSPVPGGGWTAINISATDTLPVIAQKTATAMNQLTFSVPAVADLPTIPNADLGWFINL